MMIRKTKKSLEQKNKDTAMPEDVKKTFLEHVEELRNRLFVVALVFIFGSVCGYLLRTPIQIFLIKPLNQPLYFTTPTGGFDFIISISLIFGFLITIPVLMYHIIKFIEPTLPHKIKQLTLTALISSFLLAVAGLSFAYWIGLPASLHFLSTFTDGTIQALISADKYISFVMFYLVACAVIFQLPLVLLLINRVARFPSKVLWKYFPYITLASFIIAAFATPTPDPWNQTIMALPIIILYGISVLLITWLNRAKSTT